MPKLACATFVSRSEQRWKQRRVPLAGDRQATGNRRGSAATVVQRSGAAPALLLRAASLSLLPPLLLSRAWLRSEPRGRQHLGAAGAEQGAQRQPKRPSRCGAPCCWLAEACQRRQEGGAPLASSLVSASGCASSSLEESALLK